MSFSMSLKGDWKNAGIVLKNLGTNLSPAIQGKLYDDGNIIVEIMKKHIRDQDLSWTPLADSTVRMKNGNDTIYVETGWLAENLAVRRIKSSEKGSTIFVGASAWKTHKPSGQKFSDLMIWLEFGTVHIPARPIIRPSFEEAKGVISKDWTQVISSVIRG